MAAAQLPIFQKQLKHAVFSKTFPDLCSAFCTHAYLGWKVESEDYTWFIFVSTLTSMVPHRWYVSNKYVLFVGSI